MNIVSKKSIDYGKMLAIDTDTETGTETYLFGQLINYRSTSYMEYYEISQAEFQLWMDDTAALPNNLSLGDEKYPLYYTPNPQKR